MPANDMISAVASMDLVPDIPEHVWSAILSLMDSPPWNALIANPEWQPESRMEIFHCYCQWYFQRYGSEFDRTEPDRL